jgi:hypothetical protein
MHDLDHLYELCLKMGGDPERCSFGVLVERLIEEVELTECVEKKAAVKCFERCLERCGGGEDCVKACHTAVDAAAARGIAREILRGAAQMVIDNNLRIAMPEAVAVIVSELLSKYTDADCAAKSVLFHTMNIAVVDLHNVVGSDLMLLLAPLISVVYDCVGEEADGLLEEVKAAAGEEVVAKISEALDSGTVAIKRVLIRFPPVR